VERKQPLNRLYRCSQVNVNIVRKDKTITKRYIIKPVDFNILNAILLTSKYKCPCARDPSQKCKRHL